MTETFNTTKNSKVDRTKFGGIIYPSDFNTDYRGKDNTNGSQIASRIEADWRREEKLWKKERNKNYEK